jgi:hypothetical protein
MTDRIPRLLTFMAVGAALCLLACGPRPPTPRPPAGSTQTEPIGAVGHGGFFDPAGHQIVPTEAFVAQAQAWYRGELQKRLAPDKLAAFPAFEERLTSGLKLEGQAGLVVEQRALEWLVASSPQLKGDSRTVGKIAALTYALRWKLPVGNDPRAMGKLESFKLDPSIAARLVLPELRPDDGKVFLITANSGEAYIRECAAAGVPTPPPIGQLDPAGLTGWKRRGFIPTSAQFIVGTPAEVRTFESPEGMCIALPRYTDGELTTVQLDGVICLSRTSSSVCFWDNQMGGAGFEFTSGTRIPIGVPDLAINPAGQYQAGGAEIEFGSGLVCTDCHAGENPYIIHPDVYLTETPVLGAPTTVKMGDLGPALPTFAPNRYVPIVGATWPQNAVSLAASSTPGVCRGCHVKREAGRLPHLSNELPMYCDTVLPQALARTMPRGSPGTALGTPAITNLLALCSLPPTSSTADEGDPHLTTTNGIHYDFQAAGEFTALRNADGDFEIQTRQTPVSTSFTPVADAYTGLASCVSLNTAAALRVGSRRISYEPTLGKPGSDADMQLRIDGVPVKLPDGGLDLGDGARITNADASGGLDVKAADGTRVIITPTPWASEGYWFLNIDVFHTTARDGITGSILPGSWLPLAPNGASFGPAPASLDDRRIVLNQKFADAWRVKDTTSLFDYAPGTSTASYTDRNWPPKSGAPCVATIDAWGAPAHASPQVTAIDVKTAQKLCHAVEDKPSFANCVFDVVATGNAGMADAYVRSVGLRRAAH